MTHVEVESHTLPSDDTPDIVFLCDEQVAVVEIEAKYPMPGAFQALKYRTLMCAERNLDVQSPLVKAFLVAWAIPDGVKQFCARYGIQTRVKTPQRSIAACPDWMTPTSLQGMVALVLRS